MSVHPLQECEALTLCKDTHTHTHTHTMPLPPRSEDYLLSAELLNLINK